MIGASMRMLDAATAALSPIVADPHLEARWLATLAAMEQVGVRKIVKTMETVPATVDMLEHLHHEAGHAYLFAALAERDGTAKPLALRAGLAWFQATDAEVGALIDDTELAYLVTTTLVERRAMFLYPLYKARTSDDTVRTTMDRIIQEEASHRRPIERRALDLLHDKGITLDELEAHEAQRFHVFLDAVREEVLALA